MKTVAAASGLGTGRKLLQYRNGNWIDRSPQVDTDFRFYGFVFEDRRRRLWIKIGVAGLGRLSDGTFEQYKAKDGLPLEAVSSLHEDREGTLWIGSLSAGLVSWQPRRVFTFTTDEGLPDNNVRAITESRDSSVWIGSDRGINQIRREGPGHAKTTSYSTADGLQTNFVRALLEDRRGRLWIGTTLGFDCFENGAFRAFPVPGNRANVRCAVRVIYEDRSGTIWYGSTEGLHRLRGESVRTYNQTDGLSVGEVRVILESQNGELLVGTVGGGLNRLSFADGQRAPNVTVVSSADGLSNDFVTALYEEADGTLCFRPDTN